MDPNNTPNYRGLGIIGTTGNGTYGAGGFNIGSWLNLVKARRETGISTKGLLMPALRGELVWGTGQQQGMGNQMAQMATPQQNTGYGNLDPINKFQTAAQDVLSKTSSPLGYEYFRQAAMGNKGVWDNYANSGGNTNPYQMDPAMWSKYGSGLNQYNPQDNMRAYIGMTNDLYANLQSKLGRVPTSQEVYAAQNHGMDALVGDPSLANQYSQLFI